MVAHVLLNLLNGLYEGNEKYRANIRFNYHLT